MSTDNELLPQQESPQQLPLGEKKKHSSWGAFLVLLILINLPFPGLYVAGLISSLREHNSLVYILNGFIHNTILLSPLLLPLAIIDYFAVRSYRKKQSPPWKVFIIILLTVTVILFFGAWLQANQSSGFEAILTTIIAFVLLLITSIAILFYIYIHLPDVRAKVIFYTTLASILLGLLALSVFY